MYACIYFRRSGRDSAQRRLSGSDWWGRRIGGGRSMRPFFSKVLYILSFA
jgi:hypothetical protein